MTTYGAARPKPRAALPSRSASASSGMPNPTTAMKRAACGWPNTSAAIQSAPSHSATAKASPSATGSATAPRMVPSASPGSRRLRCSGR